MREVIEHLRGIAGAGTEGYGEAADALELLEKLRAHKAFGAMLKWAATGTHYGGQYAEFYALLLQLLKGAGSDDVISRRDPGRRERER